MGMANGMDGESPAGGGGSAFGVGDILGFLESADIRRHLKDIGYRFSALEAAWIVHRNESRTFDEKKAAWIGIMRTMDDVPVAKRFNFSGGPSLFAILERYIDLCESSRRELEKPESDGGFVYLCELYESMFNGERSWLYVSSNRAICRQADAFASFGDCMAAAKAEMNAEYCFKVRFTKQAIGDGKGLVAEYSLSGELLSIEGNSGLSDDDFEILFYFFDAQWFDFPLPFRKGDILRCIYYPERKVVMVGNTYADSDVAVKKKRISGSGDFTDMNIFGYSNYDDGTIYWDVWPCYLDWEIFDGEFKDNEMGLRAVSLFLKGKIELDLLLDLYVAGISKLRDAGCAGKLKCYALPEDLKAMLGYGKKENDGK